MDQSEGDGKADRLTNQDVIRTITMSDLKDVPKGPSLGFLNCTLKMNEKVVSIK